jgi:hypothetical protein
MVDISYFIIWGEPPSIKQHFLHYQQIRAGKKILVQYSWVNCHPSNKNVLLPTIDGMV